MSPHPFSIPSDTDAAVTALYEHLHATGERPVTPATNRWLGEAEAVARDAASDSIGPDARTKRVEQALMLLESADATGDETADEHVAAAIDCCQQILS